jgi:hypothetical protein
MKEESYGLPAKFLHPYGGDCAREMRLKSLSYFFFNTQYEDHWRSIQTLEIKSISTSGFIKIKTSHLYIFQFKDLKAMFAKR